MALYTETSYDDWARRQRQSLQNSAQNLQNKQAGLQAAQNAKQKTTLESALSGLVGGLKERGSDIFNTAKNIGKTVIGGINQIGANKAVENTQKDDSKRRNEIAKRYGFNSYSEAINSGKVGDDFWNEIKNNNKQTKEKLEQNKARQGSFGDVTKINTNEAKGRALNTIDSVLGLLPGGAGAVANVAGGGISGIGDEYKRAGREGDSVNWTNARNNAIVGAASGVAGMAGGNALGKLGAKGGNGLTKLATSQLGRGIASGAAAGAVGGGLGTYLNGGSLEDALLAAREGAKAGGIGGGVMAGTMGLGGKALDKFRNRGNNAPTPEAEPMEAMTVQKNRIEQPMAQRIEAETPSTRRGIAVTDLDAGAQDIRVRNANPTESRGKYIDSVVRRSDANLPEAKVNLADRFKNNFDDSLDNLIKNGEFGEGADILTALKASGVQQPELAAIKSGAQEWAEVNNPFATYGMSSRQDLPMLDRQEYYYDTIGKVGKQGNGNLTSADVPSYMQDRLRNDAGVAGNKRFDNESIMRDIFGNDMDKADMYRLYEELAATPQGRTYDAESINYALESNPKLNARVQQSLLDQFSPTRKITIENALGQTQDVPVEDLTTNYQRSTIPARQYDQQTVRNIQEAEISTPKTVAKNATVQAEAQVVPQVESGKAIGWGGKNMEGASKKSNILQKAGKTLQETGQATKDNQVYSKLKGNFAEEMAKKQSVERLRELGYSPSEYKKAANASEVINKFYDDSVKATKTPVEAPQLRNIANEIADDFRLSAENRADLAKLIGTMLDDAVTHDGKMSEYTMDRYTPADLEKIAKKLGTMEQNLTTTSHGGSKKQNRNLRPEVEEYANALGEARNRLRNEIVEMTDYNEPELVARMKNAGMTQKQIDYVIQDHTLRGIKSRTSLFEDARNMDQQMRSDSLKRGANSSNSTNIMTQVANESGASGLVKTVAQIPAQAIGTAEKAVGKALSWAGDKIAGTPTENAGETAGRLANGAKNIVSGAAERIGNATAGLNNETLANARLNDGLTLGTYLTNQANRQIGAEQARDAVERMNNAQAVQAAQADYDNALASYQNEEQQVNNAIAMAQQAQSTSQLNRIANAMELALNAGDINAYSQLADLYSQAAKIEELKNPTASSNLNATQQKELNRMDTAANAIDELEKLYTNAGGGQGIIGGNIANLLGNAGINSDVASYNALSEGLINQIAAAVGKTDALNNEGEVKRALSLVPKITDTPQTAQTKLNTLREMLQTNRETMLSNYGA